jgi:outer membrane protein assembly factor BamB
MARFLALRPLLAVSLCLVLISCSRLPLSPAERIERTFGVRPTAVRPEQRLFDARWSKNFDPSYNTGNLPIGLGEPLIHQNIVFVGNQSGEMLAFELQSGRELWSAYDRSTYHAAPVAYQDQIIYGTVQGRVVSRHQSTGQLKYEIDLGASIESAGEIADGRILFHLRNHQIFCLDVETGKILWAYRRAVQQQTTLQGASRPLVHEGRVYVGFADGHGAAFSLEDGLLLWETRLGQAQKFMDVDTDPLIFMDQLYMGAGGSGYSLLDPATGQLIYQLPYQVSVEAKTWNQQLLLGTTDGDVVLLSRDLREVRKQNLGAHITSVNIWGPYVVAATARGRLYALDRETFEIVQTHHLGHAHSSVFSRLKVEAQHLVVLSSRNRLYTYVLRI